MLKINLTFDSPTLCQTTHFKDLLRYLLCLHVACRHVCMLILFYSMQDFVYFVYFTLKGKLKSVKTIPLIAEVLE